MNKTERKTTILGVVKQDIKESEQVMLDITFY